MTTSKRIVITKAAGQDGLILGLKLANTGHQVIGIVRNEEQKTFLGLYNPSIQVEMLGWSPQTSFEETIKSMVLFDLQTLQNPKEQHYWKPEVRA